MKKIDVKNTVPLDSLLGKAGYGSLFDIVRVVDAQIGRLIEVADGKATQQMVGCIEMFGTFDRCKNCTSLRAYHSNEQVVKLEFINAAVWLIISAPVEIDGKRYVIELIKDITKSMTVDDNDDYRRDEVATIIDKFNKAATTDALTGLMNKRFIDEKLPSLLKNSQYMGRPVSVAFIDIDGFGRITETHGRQASDHVLKEISTIMMSFVRKNGDLAARYGNDEFLFCFPGVPLKTCLEICERIRKRIEGSPVKFGNEKINVTVSIGIADSLEFETPEQKQMFELAEKRVLAVKQAGKNAVG